MNDDISLLFEFFERCGPEVRGHSPGVLENQRAAMIERFIDGQCGDVERRELAEFLQLHPVWIRWIAERVKTARNAGDTPAAVGE